MYVFSVASLVTFVKFLIYSKETQYVLHLIESCIGNKYYVSFETFSTQHHCYLTLNRENQYFDACNKDTKLYVFSVASLVTFVKFLIYSKETQYVLHLIESCIGYAY